MVPEARVNKVGKILLSTRMKLGGKKDSINLKQVEYELLKIIYGRGKNARQKNFVYFQQRGI